MKYLLDTNVCVGLLRGRASKTLAKLEIVRRENYFLCSVVLFELCFGAEKSSKPDVEMARVNLLASGFSSLPFDDACALRAGEIRAVLQKDGQPIGPFDLQIAAIALRNNDLTLITGNTSEFGRVNGLRFEDREA